MTTTNDHHKHCGFCTADLLRLRWFMDKHDYTLLDVLQRARPSGEEMLQTIRRRRDELIERAMDFVEYDTTLFDGIELRAAELEEGAEEEEQ